MNDPGLHPRAHAVIGAIARNVESVIRGKSSALRLILAAFASGDLLPVVFFSVLFGIALTGVGSTTVHAVEAGESLVGGALSEAAIQRAAELAANAAKPRSDHRGSATYKRHIINTFTARVLRGIAESQEKAA